MTQKVQNISGRLVSFLGNSGQTWHIPPRTSLELPDFELSDNAKIKKLKDRRLINIAGSDKPDADQPDKDRGKKHKPAR